MVPNPPASGERHASSRPRAPAANAKNDKTPLTPRKDGGAAKERALQDPALKDYVGSPAEGIVDAYTDSLRY